MWWAFDSPPAKISCASVDKGGELLGKGFRRGPPAHRRYPTQI